MSEKKKIRVIVSMYGGNIDKVTHNDPGLEVEVIVTENEKYVHAHEAEKQAGVEDYVIGRMRSEYKPD